MMQMQPRLQNIYLVQHRDVKILFSLSLALELGAVYFWMATYIEAETEYVRELESAGVELRRVGPEFFGPVRFV